MSTPPPSGAYPSAPHQTPSADRSPKQSAGRAVRDLTLWIWNVTWPAGLAGGAVATFGWWQRDPGQRPETFFLAASVAWILGLSGVALGSLGTDDNSSWLVAIGTACAFVGWTLHYGPHRGAWVGLLLAGTLGFVASRLWRTKNLPFLGLFAWAVALQSFVHGNLLLAPYSNLLSGEPLPWTLLALPCFAALLIRALAWATHSSMAMLVACGAAAAGPGWSLNSLLILAGLTAACVGYRFVGPRPAPSKDSGPERQPPRSARLLAQPEIRLSATILLSALLVPSAYPWFRPAPALAWLELLQSSPWPFLTLLTVAFAAPWLGSRALTVVLTAAFSILVLTTESSSRLLIDRRTEILSHAQFRVELPISSTPVNTVVLETDLVHGASLEPGTDVFRIYIDSENQRLVDEAVHAGSDTDDWASGRPDLVRQMPSTAQAWSHRVTDDGQFFRQTFRTVVHLDRPVQGRRLILRRFDTLPKDVVIRIHRLEILP